MQNYNVNKQNSYLKYTDKYSCKSYQELSQNHFIGHSREVGIILLATRKTILKAKRKALSNNACTLTILFGFHLNVTRNCSVIVVLGYECAH